MENKENKLEKITEETLLSELFEDEGAVRILNEYRMPCIACPFASLEMNDLSIGFASKMYNLDVQGLVSDLNKYYQKNEENRSS